MSPVLPSTRFVTRKGEKKKDEKLAREVKHVRSMKKVDVTPIIVMGELAAVGQRIENFIQRVRLNIGVEHLQETTPLKTLEY